MPEHLGALRHVIRYCPVIDNHGHPLLHTDFDKHDFLTSVTEAQDAALEDARYSLAHLRASRQLRVLYGLPPHATWEAILEKRKTLLDKADFVRECFAGVHTVLIDDGLGNPHVLEPYQWHSRFTTSPCKRIVRIESVAADILSSMHKRGLLPGGGDAADEEACSRAWQKFITDFRGHISTALANDEVVGFKSVICYRTGLDIVLREDKELQKAALRSFRHSYLPLYLQKNFRIEQKEINDALVIIVCQMITVGFNAYGTAKPFQFHTGLGDNDISLLKSNPGCLQHLIETFPAVPVVLLHSSYPYTREAGYLATVYKNAFVDIGEVFPMVSRDGQEHIVRQALELTPTSKILWSTDGHYFPETYWLANVQGREALETVLCECVTNEDMSLADAIDAAKDIFFNNANSLYHLRLNLPPPDTWSAEPFPGKPRNNPNLDSAPLSKNPPTTDLSDDQAILRSFTSVHQGIKFVFVQWLDYNATLRCRCLPIRSFESLVMTRGRIGISHGNLGTTQTDHITPACIPVGSIYVEPDLRSLKLMQDSGPVKNTATVMARFTYEDGRPFGRCPRACLQHIVEISQNRHHITFLVGFEIEITFCRRSEEGSKERFSPLDSIHAWGSFSDEQYTESMDLMMQVTAALETLGIEIEQFHSEAGAGQYEFILPPLPPVEAVDTLIQARQCIQQVAALHGLRATCHPRPFPGTRTAAHAHISFNTSTLSSAQSEARQMSFMASVLAHLPALCMVTMPQRVSYERIVEDGWTGGVWVAWGAQNREVPLRRVTADRWEVRCLDGCANMYLALYALLAAGVAGMSRELPMPLADCAHNPSRLTAEQRKALGITTRLPRTIYEARKAFETDVELAEVVGVALADTLMVLKKFEQEMLHEMSEEEQRVWLMERY